jgi:hypothetical protein
LASVFESILHEHATIVTNDVSLILLVDALIFETSYEWAVAGLYMSPETLARVTDNPTAWLPAVAD